MSDSEKPFKISIPDASLALLQQKLALTTLPDELDEAGWDYGVPLADIRRLVARWKTGGDNGTAGGGGGGGGYDWRHHEAQLNAELPQFTRDIEVDGGHGTLNIHYVHKKSEVQDAVPLLFVHGWPGSFLEVRKLLPLLVEQSPEHPSFHVVALSLPGYGFSEAPKKKGFNQHQMAEVGHKLMLALGYNEYVTQGGDWGYLITRTMAQTYGPKHHKAWHTNMAMAPPPHPTKNPLLLLSHFLFSYTEAEKAGLARSEWFSKRGMGYFHEQSTQPQTLGYGLADSPVGLLAWIYEKLVNWSDSYPWEDDEILTWISVYWFSRAGPAASVRIYYEAQQTATEEGTPFGQNWYTNIPQGISYFPKDLVVLPKRWVRKLPKLVFESDHTSGGHFAAYERPQEIADDLKKMFGKRGPAFQVVPGKSGYDKAPQSRL